jgi:hypothetical protein
MKKGQQSSQPRRYRSWTKVSALAYIGRVNRGDQMMGLTFLSASDFMANQGHKSTTTSAKEGN